MRLAYDLHIHSCLSPCGDNDMTPANIAGMAALAGLDVFALSDHNSARNVRAAARVAEEYGLVFVPALELNTSEEAHILCLFPTVEAAEEFGEYVYAHLAPVDNKPEFFGDQLIMDEHDSILATEPRLLIGSTSIDTYSVAALVDALGGVALPAHIDRESFSVLSNLGFYDARMGFSAVELTFSADARSLAEQHSQLRGIPYITNSDAHALGALPDAQNTLEADERSAAAVINAIKQGSTGGKVILL